MIIQRRLFYFAAIYLTLAMITACQPKQPLPPQVDIDEELAFKTIEAAEDTLRGEGNPDKQPATYILWQREDIAQVEEWLSASAVEQLNALDFSGDAAIAVFQGLKGSNGYDVVIERVGIRNDTLMIVAQFWQNPPGMESGAVMTSPYHLVKIAKDNRISPQTEVELHSYTQYHEIQ